MGFLKRKAVVYYTLPTSDVRATRSAEYQGGPNRGYYLRTLSRLLRLPVPGSGRLSTDRAQATC